MRLFIALTPPTDLREALWRETGDLREAGFPVRWVALAGLHLTLKFLGEVPPEREAAVADALERVAAAASPFDVLVRAFGAFPAITRPRVVWVGIEPTPALELLQDGVERAMAELGFEREGRIFRPHVTLGRARREARAPQFRDLARWLEGLDFEQEFRAVAVHLVQSTLRSTGAVYEARRALPLGGPAA